MRFPSFRKARPVYEFTVPESIETMAIVCFKPRFEHVEMPEMIAIQAEMEAKLDIDVALSNGERASRVWQLLEDDKLECWIIPLSDMPPISSLRFSDKVSELDTATYNAATHGYVVSWKDTAANSAEAIAGAGVIATAAREFLSGVVYDPVNYAIVATSSLDEAYALNCPTYKHIHVLWSVDERGLAWVTTRGLTKFGAPELQINDASPALAGHCGHIVSIVADRVAAMAKGARNGVVSVEKPVSISSNDIRIMFGDGVSVEGAKEFLIQLEYEHDAASEMEAFLTLKPPKGFRGQHNEWLAELLTQANPDPRAIVPVARNDEEMREAERRANAELPAIRTRFEAGLEPGAVLSVKHGFPDNSGSLEHMWVSVSVWHDGRIKGQLMNDPFACPDLRAGQTVSFAEDEVSDWILTTSDGSRLGGYTSDVLNRRRNG